MIPHMATRLSSGRTCCLGEIDVNEETFSTNVQISIQAHGILKPSTLGILLGPPLDARVVIPGPELGELGLGVDEPGAEPPRVGHPRPPSSFP